MSATDDSRVLRTLRAMAWERAKGELRSIGHTFWSSSTSKAEQYADFDAAVEFFIKAVEDDGLHE